MSIVVVVPTRTRPGKCAELIKSFDQTADKAELLFVTDSDDDSYADMDWQGHRSAVMDPRGNLVEKLNRTVASLLSVEDDERPIMWIGDDHEFVTPHWDTLLETVLNEDLNGSGWVYPNDMRRSDIPETWMASRDVIRALGWYANPVLSHYYIDNSIGDIGKRTGLVRYVPEVIIPHRHYQVDKQMPRDSLYSETEEKYGDRDYRAFQEWRGGAQVAMEVSILRRMFNPDVAWVTGKV